MNLLGREKPASQLVTNGRFELEQDGLLATLDYTVTGNILALVHTEIPKDLRGTGVASTLVQTAFQWARDHQKKVDVVCPFVAAYLETHPEFSDMVLR
jgi:predicted GNAT family acetyltransferase